MHSAGASNIVHSPVIHRNGSLRIGVLALSITLQQWLLVSDAYWVLMGEGLVDLIFVSFFFFFFSFIERQNLAGIL